MRLGYELVDFASSCKFIKFIFQCFTKDGSGVEGDFGVSAVSLWGSGWTGVAWRIRFSLSFRSVTSFLAKLESVIYLIFGVIVLRRRQGFGFTGMKR